jgi:hypothetical protein
MNPTMGIFILVLFLVAVIVVFTRRNGSGSLFTGSNSESTYTTVDDRYNAQKKEREDELNRLLEKIHKHGIERLSSAERSRLDELTKK